MPQLKSASRLSRTVTPSRLSHESSERCARLFRSLRAKWNLTLADCALAMGLSPRSVDASLSRMENAIGHWTHEQLDRFVALAASYLDVDSDRLRTVLLGDADGGLESVQDTLAWRYARWGSEAHSKLLCRLECHWTPRSRWVVFFRRLPEFLVPDRAIEQFMEQHRRSHPRDTIGEMAQVFAAMHERFLLWDAAERPRLVLAPLSGSLSSLFRRDDSYAALDAEALAETIEFLRHDCVEFSGTVFARAGRTDEQSQVMNDIEWVLIGNGLVVRQRKGIAVLDHITLTGRPTPEAFATIQQFDRLSRSALLRDETQFVGRLFTRVLAEISGENYAAIGPFDK